MRTVADTRRGARRSSSLFAAEPDFDLHVDHPSLRSLLEIWRDASPAGQLPQRSDISPRHIGRHLPHVVLVDVEGEPPRYRWRLIGTHITQAMGRDSTGRWLDELYLPEAMAEVETAFGLSLEHRAAIRFTGTFAFAGKSYFSFESVNLPLVDRHDRIVMLMIGVVAAGATAMPPRAPD